MDTLLGRPIADAPLAGGPHLDSVLLASALQAYHAQLATSSARVTSLLAHLIEAPAATTDLVAEIARTLVPQWHFEMLNDIERCDAYSVALDRRVRPGMLVLDIGSGAGLLALMAARAGAERVVTCETNPMLAEIARRIIAAAGMSHRITVVPKLSTELQVGRDLPRRADLIVSEIVDCGLVGEGLVPTMQHARAELLAPGGELLPQRCRLVGTVVSSPALRNLNHVEFASGFDVRLLNLAASRRHVPIHSWGRPLQHLTVPTPLLSLDLLHGSLTRVDASVELVAAAGGLAHGVLAWFEMDLGAGVTITNSPDNRSSHWEQAFVPFPTPVPVIEGASLTVTVDAADERLSARLTNPTNHTSDYTRSIG